MGPVNLSRGGAMRGARAAARELRRRDAYCATRLPKQRIEIIEALMRDGIPGDAVRCCGSGAGSTVRKESRRLRGTG